MPFRNNYDIAPALGVFFDRRELPFGVLEVLFWPFSSEHIAYGSFYQRAVLLV